MIEIESRWVENVRNAQTKEELYDSLQTALKLEHATVPLYLSAYFSITPGTNTEVAAALRSVVREEMLHFAIVANILSALGGRAVIDDPSVVPTYPGPLPMGVADGMDLHLRRMSIEQCRVFMAVEEPEHPVTPDPAPDTHTIGDFYGAIIDKIREFDDAAFGNPSAPQVVSPWFPSDQLFAITDVTSAVRGLRVIVRQGEGTTTSPFERDDSTELAHYYQFGEVAEQRRLVRGGDGTFAFTGAKVDFDPSTIYPLQDDPVLPPTTRPAARMLAVEFCTVYRRLLASLQQTFTGSPATLDTAMGLMYELRLAALAMVQTADPGNPGHCLTPTWQYLP